MTTEAWQDILRTAVVGTDRQATAVPRLSGPLGDALGQLPTADPAKSLLSAAALLSIYEAAGHLPSAAQVTSETSPPEQLPPCSPRAAMHLTDMLSGDHAALLPEWLGACAAAQRRVPHRHLPALLDLAATRRELRDAVLRVIGHRGQWLLARNPAWRFDAPADAGVESWQMGTRDQRLALLRRLRSTDPAAAREMVRATWLEESPDDRGAILAAFEVGIGPDDEPFLEEGLDDRRKEVRKTAADLLARLPNSQLSQRMLARLRPLVQVEVAKRGKLMKLVAGERKSLKVTPPEDCDKACVRDGVDPKPPAGVGLGEKAWQLQQMLAAVPPAEWTRNSGMTPEELIDAAEGSEWHQAVIQGWTQAAARHGDAAWAEALLQHHLRPGQKAKEIVAAAESVATLVRSIDPGRLESAALESLRSLDTRLSGHPALAVLTNHDRAWGRELSAEVHQRLRRDLASPKSEDTRMWQWVQQDLGRLLSPDVAGDVCADWEPKTPWAEPVARMQKTLQFRHDMLKEIRS